MLLTPSLLFSGIRRLLLDSAVAEAVVEDLGEIVEMQPLLRALVLVAEMTPGELSWEK